jgi:hypothetical protein
MFPGEVRDTTPNLQIQRRNRRQGILLFPPLLCRFRTTDSVMTM